MIRAFFMLLFVGCRVVPSSQNVPSELSVHLLDHWKAMQAVPRLSDAMKHVESAEEFIRNQPEPQRSDAIARSFIEFFKQDRSEGFGTAITFLYAKISLKIDPEKLVEPASEFLDGADPEYTKAAWDLIDYAGCLSISSKHGNAGRESFSFLERYYSHHTDGGSPALLFAIYTKNGEVAYRTLRFADPIMAPVPERRKADTDIADALASYRRPAVLKQDLQAADALKKSLHVLAENTDWRVRMLAISIANELSPSRVSKDDARDYLPLPLLKADPNKNVAAFALRCFPE